MTDAEREKALQKARDEIVHAALDWYDSLQGTGSHTARNVERRTRILHDVCRKARKLAPAEEGS